MRAIFPIIPFGRSKCSSSEKMYTRIMMKTRDSEETTTTL